MKIAFFVSEFPVLSETFVLNQIASLIDRGYEVEILAENATDTGRNHDVVRKYELLDKVIYSDVMPRGQIAKKLWWALRKIALHPTSSGVKLAKSLNWLRYRGGGPNFRLFKFVSSLLPRQDYDAIICHFGPNGSMALSLREVGVLRGPILTYFHGWDMSSYVRARGPRAYARLFAKGDLFLPISERWERRLVELGCDRNRIRVHHMGIPVGRFSFVPRRRRPGQPTRLVSVARLVEKKGIEVALRAIAILIRDHRIIYTVVGDGPLRPRLTALAEELGLGDAVHFAGALPQQEVVNVLRESDILLAPSVTAEDGDEEGIPVAIMEAMAMGMPVVSTRHSGIPELVEDGVCGFLAPERNAEALAERLALLLGNPELWEKMGTAGRAKVAADFNLEKLTDELSDLLNGLPAQGSSEIEGHAACPTQARKCAHPDVARSCGSSNGNSASRSDPVVLSSTTTPPRQSEVGATLTSGDGIRPVAESLHLGQFDTEHLRANLKQRSLRGGAITLLSQGTMFILNIGSTMVLARLLTPADFGLLAMVAPIVGFVGLFKDLGLSMATIQNDRIDHRQVSTLFWINVAVSAALAAATVLLAPAVGSFYGDPRLVWITVAFGCMMILGGCTAQHLALIQRQMRFGSLAAVEIVAVFMGIVAGITAALAGLGYWSLVVMQATNAITNLIMVWVLSAWRPGRPVRGAGVRGMLRFGGNLTGATAMAYVSRNIDNVLIGKVWGEAALGLYSKAYGLLLLPIAQINAPISRVAIPALSRLQNEPERYRNAYLNIVDKVLLISLPGVVTLIAGADLVVEVLLGPQWAGATEIFFWLGIAALTQPLTNTTGWLFITQGRTGEHLRWAIVGSILVTLAVVGGLPWGPIGVAASYAVTGLLIRTPLLLWLVSRRGPVKLGDFFIVSVPFALSASVMGAALFAVHSTWGGNPFVGLLSLLAVAYAVQFGVLLFFPRHRKAFAGMWNRRPT